MYAEGSNVKTGSQAHLISPKQEIGKTHCLTFYYHMNGNSIGNLKVVRFNRHGDTEVLLDRWGSQDKTWRKLEVDLPPGEVQLVFTVTRGYSYFSGDIAIDDVMLSPGFCRDKNKGNYVHMFLYLTSIMHNHVGCTKLNYYIPMCLALETIMQ